MKKPAFISTLLILSISLHAQGIKGYVIDDKKEPMINAVVQIYQNDIQKGGVITDKNGLYTISPLDTGEYSVLFSYNSYDSVLITKVLIRKNEYATIDCQLYRSKNIRTICTLRTYTIPLIDIDNPSKRTYDREEIRRMPY